MKRFSCPYCGVVFKFAKNFWENVDSITSALLDEAPDDGTVFLSDEEEDKTVLLFDEKDRIVLVSEEYDIGNVDGTVSSNYTDRTQEINSCRWYG